jgi:hypothetical protein
MGLISDLVDEVRLDEEGDDTLAVSLHLVSNAMADGAYDLIGEGLELAYFVQTFAPNLLERENLAALVAVVVRAIWGYDALRVLTALIVNRGPEQLELELELEGGH